METREDQPLFVIDDDPVVPWPVSVKVPEAGGTYGEYQFTALMRVLAPEAYEEMFKVDAAAAEANPAMSEVLKKNAETFAKLITGWDGVNDREGNAVAFTPAVLAAQITGPRGPALSVGIWRAIEEVRFGTRQTPGARLGN